MLELRPSLKAIKGLAIPSVSISIFLLVIVADLELVWNIISGNNYFSYVVRLVMLAVEIWLFKYFYDLELKIYRQEKFNSQMKDIDNQLAINITALGVSKYDLDNYIPAFKSSNRVRIEEIEDVNKEKWYKFTGN